MTDAAWQALGDILPSLFGLITAIFLPIIAFKLNTLHKTINSGLTVRVEEAQESGRRGGIIEEKDAQIEREKDHPKIIEQTVEKQVVKEQAIEKVIPPKK